MITLPKVLGVAAAAGIAGAVAAAVFLPFGGDDDDSSPPSDVTPTATIANLGVPTECPVDKAICDFAYRVEHEYREGDPSTLISPKSKYFGEKGVTRAAGFTLLGGATLPRVIAIGCPVRKSGPACDEAFSLVLTTNALGEELATGHRVLLGFAQDGASLPVITINILVPPLPELLKGGVYPNCLYAGLAENSPCLGTRFYSFVTGPVVPAPPTPAPPATPGADPLAGIDAVELKPGMQSSIGYDTVAYYSTGCFACGRPRIPNLYRAYRDSSGRLRTDDLFGPLLARSGGYPGSVAADWERGHFLVLVCSAGYCGGEGDPSPDAKLRLFESRDGAVTFSELDVSRFPIQSRLLGFTVDEAIVLASEPKGVEYVLRYFLYPSTSALQPPPAIGTAQPFPDHDGRIGWLNYGPTTGYFDSTGNLLIPTSPGRRLVYSPALPVGWLAQWADESAAGTTFGIYDGTAKLTAALRTTHFADFRGNILPGGLLVGNVELAAPFGFGVDARHDACKDGQPIYPSLVNWNTGTVFPIIELGDCENGRHKFVNYILARSVVRVATGGDCLNVRAEPSASAASLGCFADGVLLSVRVEGVSAVPGWKAVFAPDMRPGWVSEESLER